MILDFLHLGARSGRTAARRGLLAARTGLAEGLQREGLAEGGACQRAWWRCLRRLLSEGPGGPPQPAERATRSPPDADPLRESGRGGRGPPEGLGGRGRFGRRARGERAKGCPRRPCRRTEVPDVRRRRRQEPPGVQGRTAALFRHFRPGRLIIAIINSYY